MGVVPQLSDREKLALSFAAYTGCDDWRYIYHMSLERPRKTPPKDSSGVSRWKHSPRVVTYFKDQQAAAAARIVEEKKRAINDFIEGLPDYLRKAIRENRDISPEEFALPPRLQDIGQKMTKAEKESPTRANPNGRYSQILNDGQDNDGQNEGEGIAPTRQGNELLPGQTDFLDRDELLKYLRRAANDTKDDKLRVDMLKQIADLQRFKAEETGKALDVTRAYLPLRCYECPLYLSQKAATTEGAQ